MKAHVGPSTSSNNIMYPDRVVGYRNLSETIASETGCLMPGIGMCRAIVTGEHLSHCGLAMTLKR